MRTVRDRIRGWFVFTMVVTLALLAASACGGATTSTPTPVPTPTSVAAVQPSPSEPTPTAVPTPAPMPTPTTVPTPTSMPTPTTASATPTMGHGMSGHGMGSATPTVSNEFQAGMLVIRNVWARPATKADALSAVYMVIENTGDQPDRLLHAHCDVAGMVELHETKMEGGVMKMQPVDGIDIPAKGTVELKPGGLHIMLIGLTRDLNPGDEIELELHFDKAGHVPVKAVVQKP
jgi:copper(I)-binding protein